MHTQSLNKCINTTRPDEVPPIKYTHNAWTIYQNRFKTKNNVLNAFLFIVYHVYRLYKWLKLFQVSVDIPLNDRQKVKPPLRLHRFKSFKNNTMKTA